MKYFISKYCTRKKLRELICKFAKEQGVSKVIFNAQGKRVSGTYNARTKNVYLNLNLTKYDMLCAFFHELGHHEAVRQNKWKDYHFNLVEYMYKDTVYKIENKIDKMGNALWRKHVYLKQWGKYKYFYPKSQMNQFLKKSNAL